MTDREDIIRMAWEAGAIVLEDSDTTVIERFFQAAYSAGAADEREALAKDWEARHGYDKYGVAAEIRARGQDPMPLFDDWNKDWK